MQILTRPTLRNFHCVFFLARDEVTACQNFLYLNVTNRWANIFLQDFFGVQQSLVIPSCPDPHTTGTVFDHQYDDLFLKCCFTPDLMELFFLINRQNIFSKVWKMSKDSLFLSLLASDLFYRCHFIC